MEYVPALIGGGLVVLVAELIVPLRYLGALGTAVVAGGVAGLLFPEHFWLAFTLASLVSVWLSGWVLSSLYQLTNDFSSLVTAASSLIERKGLVVEAIDPVSSLGKVEIEGETWCASAPLPIAKGASVDLDQIDGGCVLVRREP